MQENQNIHHNQNESNHRFPDVIPSLDIQEIEISQIRNPFFHFFDHTISDSPSSMINLDPIRHSPPPFSRSTMTPIAGHEQVTDESFMDISVHALTPGNRGYAITRDYLNNQKYPNPRDDDPFSGDEAMLPKDHPKYNSIRHRYIDAPKYLLTCRLQFLSYGLLYGFILIIFASIPSWLILDGIKNYYSVVKDKTKFDWLMPSELKPDLMCFFPYSIIESMPILPGTYFHITFAIIVAILSTYLRFVPGTAWYAGLNNDMKTIVKTLKAPLFFAFLAYITRSIVLILSPYPRVYYSFFSLVLFTIISIWFFHNIQREMFQDSFWKIATLYSTLFFISALSYANWTVSLYFQSNSDVTRALVRLVIHPFATELSMTFMRLLYEHLVNHSIASTDLYFIMIGPQFFFNLMGRFMIANTNHLTLSIVLAVGTSFVDLFFRSTTWFRDLYLFLKFFKEPQDNEFESPIALDWIFAHYHLYYFDEISSYASIIVASFFTYFFRFADLDFILIDRPTILLQTIFSLIFEYGLDFIRTYLLSVTFYHSFRPFLSTSIDPSSLFPLIKDKSLGFKIGAWWLNLDLWIHSLWEIRHKHFFFLTLLSYIGVIWFILTNFIWTHMCFHPIGDDGSDFTVLLD